MSTKKKSTRGGKRDGSGRKKGPVKVTLGTKVLPATKTELTRRAKVQSAQAKSAVSVGEVIDDLVSNSE